MSNNQSLRCQLVEAKLMVDHRVRAAGSELVGSQVDHGMVVGAERVVEALDGVGCQV